MSQPLLQPGSLIDDHFRLERQLSTSTTSSLWVAEDLRLEGRVVIKFLSAQHVQDASVRERFMRESQAICKVRSPHVVQVLDRGISHGLPYLVMELLEGEDLERLLVRERMLSLAETASMLDQLCRGLARVHKAGYVHRDIKPDNVFVIHESDGGHFIKLLDFGVVKTLESNTASLTQTDMIVGTAHYLSPEQITAPTSVDERADVWAVGVLAYRMLFGQVPFDAETWPLLCECILRGEYSLPSEQQPQLPATLDTWFARVLQRDPNARFQHVQDASAALSRIARAHASGVTARPALRDSARGNATAVVARAGSRPRRPSIGWVALCITLALTVLCITWWVARDRYGLGFETERLDRPQVPPNAATRTAPPQPTAAEPTATPETVPPPITEPSAPTRVDPTPPAITTPTELRGQATAPSSERSHTFKRKHLDPPATAPVTPVTATPRHKDWGF